MSSSPVVAEIGIHRVLAAIDFSPPSIKALNHAIEIVRIYGATFHLAHVVSLIGYVMVGADAVVAAVDSAAQELRELEQRLSHTGALAGLPHEMLVSQGDVWRQLGRVVKEQGIDLIVLGTHGKTGLRKLVLGSIAESIFQHALCPVLTVGPCAPADPPLYGELSHILYPTDLSPGSAKAAAYAVSLAKEHGAELTVVHVRETGEAGNPAEEKREFINHFQRQVPGDLPPKWWYEQRAGLMDETILGLAKERHVGLIVLGLHSRRPFLHPRTWMHAYKIVSEAYCPVLTIRGG